MGMAPHVHEWLALTVELAVARQLLDINMGYEMRHVLDKVRQARTVAKEVLTEVEGLADEMIAKRSLKDEAQQAFAPHLALMRETKDGLDALTNEIREFSNSPPLDSASTASDGPSTENPPQP
jgi:hypothetical protein